MSGGASEGGTCPRQALAAAAGWGLLALGIVTVVTTGIGIVRSYSPVHYWDSWNGIVLFYERVQAGHWSDWVSLHNEHRPIVPRLLYYTSMHFFGGSNAYLLACNAALHAIAVAIFLRIARELQPTREGRLAAAGIVLVFMATWVQQENFYWEFQSQYWASFSFALLAFHALARCAKAPGPRPLAVAIAAAMASTYSLGNGILVFPLLLGQGVMTGVSKRGLAAIAIVFACNLAPMLIGMQGTKFDMEAESRAPSMGIETMHGVVRAAGGPAYAIAIHRLGQWFRDQGAKCAEALGFTVTRTDKPAYIADMAGLISIALTAGVVLLAALRRERSGAVWSLIAILLFAQTSGALMAMFRIHFGLGSMLTSRYTTLAFFSWTALTLLLVRSSRGPSVLRRTAWLTAAGLAVLLMPYQVAACRTDYAIRKLERNVAALSLKMGLRAPGPQRRIYWDTGRFPELAGGLIRREHGVFGTDWMRAMEEPGPAAGEALPVVRAEIERAEPIEEPGYLWMSGWIYAEDESIEPRLVVFSDSEGAVSGYATCVALTGPPPDRAPNEFRIMWSGFLRAETGGTDARLLGKDNKWYALTFK